jgi:hypothetical protein
MEQVGRKGRVLFVNDLATNSDWPRRRLPASPPFSGLPAASQDRRNFFPCELLSTYPQSLPDRRGRDAGPTPKGRCPMSRPARSSAPSSWRTDWQPAISTTRSSCCLRLRVVRPVPYFRGPRRQVSRLAQNPACGRSDAEQGHERTVRRCCDTGRPMDTFVTHLRRAGPSQASLSSWILGPARGAVRHRAAHRNRGLLLRRPEFLSSAGRVLEFRNAALMISFDRLDETGRGWRQPSTPFRTRWL